MSSLEVVQRGIVTVPWIDQQMATHARREGDATGMIMAYWSHAGWCQYVWAERANRASVCRMHGAGGGAPKGNGNALKHGDFTAETLRSRDA